METLPVTPTNENHLYASIGRRLLAFFLDGLIITVPAIIANSLIPILGGVVVWFFYGPVMESSEVRATLGKHLAGIQVSDEMGRKISLKAAVIRNVLKAISSVLLFVGFFFALFTRRKQALHDMLADTFVVYGRSESPVADAWLKNVKDIFGASGARSSGDESFSAGEATILKQEQESALTKLERLQSLREKGALSEEEFQAAKKKILGEEP